MTRIERSYFMRHRNSIIRNKAKTFFIARFRRNPKYDKNYFEEWVSRFKTGVPENYMDSHSRRVYTKMINGTLKMPKRLKTSLPNQNIRLK